MLYPILAYHAEGQVLALTAQQDAALMAGLDKVHDRLTQQGKLGPAAGPSRCFFQALRSVQRKRRPS
jgi:hypothetical protein